MRVSKQVMAENNEKIVNEASRLFRENGIEATSVADVMGAAGLTHGGFYRHFASKDELTSAAIDKAFGEIINRLKSDIAQQGAAKAVDGFVRYYLSEHHVNSPGNGCPIAALGAEVDRQSKVHNREISRGSEQLLGLIAQAIEGTPEEARTKATGLLALLVGSLVLARSAKSKRAMNETLSSGHRLAKLCIT